MTSSTYVIRRPQDIRNLVNGDPPHWGWVSGHRTHGPARYICRRLRLHQPRAPLCLAEELTRVLFSGVGFLTAAMAIGALAGAPRGGHGWTRSADSRGSVALNGMPIVYIFGHAFRQGPQGRVIITLSYAISVGGAGTGFAEALWVGSILGLGFFLLIASAAGLGITLLALAVVPLVGLVTRFANRWEAVGQDVDDFAWAQPSAVATETTLGSKICAKA